MTSWVEVEAGKPYIRVAREIGETGKETLRKSEEERVSKRKSEAPERRQLMGGRWRVL